MAWNSDISDGRGHLLRACGCHIGVAGVVAFVYNNNDKKFVYMEICYQNIPVRWILKLKEDT